MTDDHRDPMTPSQPELSHRCTVCKTPTRFMRGMCPACFDAVRRQALAELARSDEWVPQPGEVPQRHVVRSGRTPTPETLALHQQL